MPVPSGTGTDAGSLVFPVGIIMRFLPKTAGAAIAAAIVTYGGLAAAATTSTVTSSDGTVIQTTVNSLNDIQIRVTGGPVYGSSPADIHFTTIQPGTDSIFYRGTITQGGATSDFTCTLNTVTKQVTGTGACAVAFSDGTTPSSPPSTTATPPTVTSTTTTTTETSATTTSTLSDGTTVTITTDDQAVISDVEADQLILAILGDRLTVSAMQSFVTSRVGLLSLAAAVPVRTTARDGYVGRSAGAEAGGLGVWVNATGTYTEDDHPGSAKDGWTGAGAIGVDVMLENTVVGAYAGYDSADLDGPNLAYKSDGWTVGAYGSWSSSPAFRVTATVGYGQHDVSYRRQSGGALSFGDTNRDQVFGSISFQTQLALSDRLVAVPSLGVSTSSSKTDAYTDNAGRKIGKVDSDLSTATLGGALFYRGDGILPYISASLSEDLDDTPGVDGSYGTIGAGVALPLSDNLSVAFTAQRLLAKEHEEETTIGATLRRGF